VARGAAGREGRAATRPAPRPLPMSASARFRPLRRAKAAISGGGPARRRLDLAGETVAAPRTRRWRRPWAALSESERRRGRVFKLFPPWTRWCGSH
jgi:hypothetical protein